MKLTSALILVVVVALTAPSPAAEYYLSPEGSDENAGTRKAPWQSVQKANDALEPGDTAIFLPGEYAGPIAPANSGTADAPITYRSAEFRAARLVPGERREIIVLDGHEHIVIADFYVDAEDRGNWGLVTDSHHITISGCEMRRNPRIMLVLASSQVRMVDNHFSADRPRGDMIHLRDSSELLFEGNSTAHSGHCPLRIQRCINVVVRSNVFRCEWGRNYEFWKCARLLIEGNVFTRARDSAGSGGACSKNLFDYSIFRHNLIYDNHYLPMCSGSYIWGGAAPDSPLYRGPFRAVNTRYYHNTFSENLGPTYMLTGINVSANVFRNNIFHRNDWTGGHVHIDRRDGVSRDNRFVSNLFWSDEPGQALVRYGADFWTIEEADRNTPTTGDFWSEFHENVDADPAFVDVGNRDYRLTADSGAINAGTPLTWTVGAGTGSVLPVDDGIPFFDGFGIEGEEGDWIAVGTGDNTAQVRRVELRYYLPALLHLDREVSWENAAPVSLPWAGERPDAGAFEHGLSHPTRMIALATPAAPEAGAPVQFSLDTLGKELEAVTWDFEDGTFSDEAAPTHVFSEPGNYGITVRATFPGGRRGVAAAFVRVKAPVDPTAPFVEADFEDETRLTHWDYQFKFYRPHQTGSARVDREDGQGKAMHIFYDPNKANRTAAQVAPGVWDIDDYPLVRFQYRIPEGVPVAAQFNAFPARGRPSTFLLAGTPDRSVRIGDQPGYTLVDDGQWREITMDVRRLRDAYPDLRHLRQFMFSTPWTGPPPPRQWLHFPALQSEFTSSPDGPEDTARLHNLDIVLLRAREAGAWLEMPFTLREEVTGELFVDLLDHDTRGTVRILLNGEVIVEEYDHYTEGISRESVSLGVMALPAGEHVVRVQVTPRRVGFVGLIGVTMRPEGAPAEVERAVEDFEFWFDEFAILPDDGN